MPPLRAVMDTNVLYAGLRSELGWSYAVFMALRHGRWMAVLSNHLIHEYEEILKAHAAELGLTLAEIDTLLDAICARAEEWPLAPGWLPILGDPDDEMLVQLAYDSAARRIITHNLRHLAPARAIGIAVLPPREFAAMDPRAMTLHIEISDAIARQARDLAARDHITVDSLIAAALTAQLDHAPHRPTIAERAVRVDWEKVDAILARVPASPPKPGDERQPE